MFDDDMVRVTLDFDDGESLECEVVCVFIVEAYPDKEYAAVCPLDENLDDVYIFGVKRTENDEAELFDIEDDAEFDAACEELDRLIDEVIED